MTHHGALLVGGFGIGVFARHYLGAKVYWTMVAVSAAFLILICLFT